MAHPGGRPTKYTPELVEKARHYVDNYEDYDDVIPSLEALSLELGISRETIYDWKDKHQEFSDIVRDCMSKQARVLAHNGLKGSFNASIVKLMLTKHGYSDRQETKQEITAEINKDLSDEELDAIIQRAERRQASEDS